MPETIEKAEEKPIEKDEREFDASKATPEEIERARRRFAAGFGYADPLPEDEQETENQSSSSSSSISSSSSSSAKGSSSSSSSPKAKRTPKSKTNQETAEDLVERGVLPAVERIVDKIESRFSTKPQEKPAATSLDPKAQAQLKAYQKMEELYPENKGITDRIQKFWGQEATHISEWEKANPDRPFNENDEEHQTWYQKHAPVFDEDQLEEAKIELRVAPRLERMSKEIESKQSKEIAELRYKEKLREETPQIHNSAHNAIVQLVEEVDPELAKLLEVNGTKVVNEETANKILAHDPAAYEVIDGEAAMLRHKVAELEKLSRFPDHYPSNPDYAIKLPDGDKFYPHREINNFAVGLEDELAALPAEDTEKGGKKFVIQQDFNERLSRITGSDLAPERKKAAIQDLQSRYWTLSVGDISRAMVKSHADKVKKTLQKISGLVEKRNKSASSSSSEVTAEKPEVKVTSEEPVTREKPRSPSTASGSDKADKNGSGSTSSGLTAEGLDKSMFG